jgi:hypothetical protein
MIKRFHWRIPPLWLQDHLEFGPAKRHAAAILMLMCIHDFISEYQKSTCKEQGAFCLPDL